MRFIGDVHAKFGKYLEIISDCDASIQCGDMGIGFGTPFPGSKVKGWHMFIRGNHDKPTTCARNKRWIPDGTFFNYIKKQNTSIFCLGGAWSIDQEDRIAGWDWWPTEECSYALLQKIIDKYAILKPEIVVTHDCPSVMAHVIKSYHEWDNSKTRRALDTMFEAHRPDVWIHGHHHINKTADIAGTRFFALAELCYIDLEI